MNLLIGFKNPLPSELAKLFKTNLLLDLDKKLKFKNFNENLTNKDNYNDLLKISKFNNKNSLIGLIFFILQKKNNYDETLILNLIDIYNKNLYNNQNLFQLLIDNNCLFTKENILELEKETDLIIDSANFYDFILDSELLYKLIITSVCLIIESNELSHSFLIDIEKSNLENRKLNEVISYFLNFMNKRNLKEGKCDDLFVEILYILYSLKTEITEAKQKISLYFKIEDKLNNKPLFYNNSILSSLKTFKNNHNRIKNYFKELNEKLIELNKKFEDKNIKYDFEYINDTDNLDNIMENISLSILISFSKYKIKSKILELKKKKKGFKITENFHSLIDFLKFDDVEIIVKDNNSVFAEINLIKDFSKKLNYDLKELIDQSMVSKNDERRKPKLPKGTRDFNPKQMAIKNFALEKIKAVFKKHGAVEIDTPVFELRETLLGKYGEEGGKLIYNLEDQGGELLSLRYDLTVPFSRFIALNNIQKIKRYHISKVYRRDQPAIDKGRFREFYQCDFDICGKYDKMAPDSEIVKIIVDILRDLNIGEFKLKISHRLLLEAIIEESDCEMKKFKAICSSIDKLDKESWETVKEELIKSKGLNEDQTQKLSKFVVIKGDLENVIKTISDEQILGKNKKAQQVIEEMKILLDYLKKFNCLDNVVFDLSLARGLDYYTGIIFEAVLSGANVGSISGGGRYDNLIGMFSNKNVPAVGMSIGIERIFVILEKKLKDQIKVLPTQIYVANIGKNLNGIKLEIVERLWNNNISTEFAYEHNPKFDRVLKYCLENEIQFLVLIGEDEIKNNKIKLKDFKNNVEVFLDYDENLENKIKEKIN